MGYPQTSVLDLGLIMITTSLVDIKDALLLCICLYQMEYIGIESDTTR